MHPAALPHTAAFGAIVQPLSRECRDAIVCRRGYPRRFAVDWNPAAPRFGGSRKDWQPVCRAALKLPRNAGAAAIAGFFQRHFTPVAVKAGSSLFTGYYEPEIEGALRRRPGYDVPLYRKPADVVKTRTKAGYARRTAGGGLAPYFTRKQIEQGALRGRGLELVWLRDATDAFFLHIQGSGRIRLAEGGVMRAGFAAKNGRPYTPIGRVLIRRGAIARDKMSMQAIRAWLLLNPGKARELFWQNQSFIFFRKVAIKDPRLGPPGAQGIELAAEHSLAVDPKFHAYGTPLWLETRTPTGRGGALEPFSRLMVAQDTGSAIRGRARGDIFFGSGEQAGHAAGLMQSPGRLVLLLPKSLASRLAR